MNELGKGELIGKRCYYYENELAIDYDDDRKVEFIEFLGGAEGSLRPIVHGVSVFETPADDVASGGKPRIGRKVPRDYGEDMI